MSDRILIIEHNFRERMELTRYCEDIGYKVDSVQDGLGVDLSFIDDKSLIIADIDAPNFNALSFLKKVKDVKPLTEVIVISERPLVEDAVNLMRHGALDFLVKPISFEQIQLYLKSLSAKKSRSSSNLDKDSKGANSTSSMNRGVASTLVEIITSDRGMQRVLNMAKRVADSTASVLIQGESGTGKELIARFIHQNSKRASMAFVALNCAALPENLLESELFGHEKGAFTGAISRKEGKFELANNGTLFLDEITEMQYHLQAKLLRVVQEKMVDRLGGREPVPVDVRIIASTNREVKEAIQNGEFREDLYHRLNTIPLTIPPLRDRQGDLKLLCDHFIKKYSILDARDVKKMTPEVYKILSRQKFSGNVRELENMIHRAVLLAQGEIIELQDLLLEELYDYNLDNNIIEDNDKKYNDKDEKLDLDTTEPLIKSATMRDTLDPEIMGTGILRDIEERVIFSTLDRTEGNRTHAAKLLGISVRTLRNKLNEYKEKR
ncbi:MAG: sigma-54-dependent Fis family transcriptional regulator [Desulfamplus sp.]|nr:sigma-54-dependent Fis family transcriptional regulator [Desulfamplus sp.]